MAMQGTRREEQPGAIAFGDDGHRAWGEARRFDPHRIAQGLGWFSLALGLGGALAPRQVARLIGAPDGPASRAALRAVGLREIACGLGVLSSPRPAGWLWARVAGDVMDLALLRAARRSPAAGGARLGAATVAVLGVAALDAAAGRAAGRRHTGAARAEPAATVREAVTVQRPAAELYRFWRDFSNHPRFMQRVESVEVTGDRRSHWRARLPGGIALEWDSEVVQERPDELIAWRSVEGSTLHHEGTVRFTRAPGGRGTEVTVDMAYTPPGGKLTATMARLVGQAPEQHLREDLRRFKQFMETGQVTVSEGVLFGPARPPEAGARHGQEERR
jgi:uncharacterized membrane protein